MIKDRATFETYPWPDPDGADYAMLDALTDVMPTGMKPIGFGSDGVLENMIKLVGYEQLCYLLADDVALVADRQIAKCEAIDLKSNLRGGDFRA